MKKEVVSPLLFSLFYNVKRLDYFKVEEGSVNVA
jgi:hypothetical protein